ncbi:Glyoxalase 3 at C-terminar half [Coccomyxa sp. Obi]|nr:Glyoxalase 3 at C-terminar half [Coccomyxa sp. Obi]
MLHCLQSMYAADSARVFTTAGLTDTFPCTMGVKQGCPLSPLLFGIYLDGLQKILEATESTDAPCLNGKPVPVMLYADDLALLSHSREGLQKSLDMLGTFSHDRGLTVSVEKTKVLVFAKRKTLISPPVVYAEQPLAQLERVLIVCTSEGVLGDTDVPTGVWAEELAAPYYLFLKKGYLIDIVSIAGGKVPIDPLSVALPYDKISIIKHFLADVDLQKKLNSTISVAYIDPTPYAAIFFPGGHGIAWDGPFSKEIMRIVESAFAAGKVIGAVCHGPAALVNAKITDPSHPLHGQSILTGKQVTGLSNSEEDATGRATLVPFLLEDKLREVGGNYVRGPRDLGPYAIRAGQIITGQNPASSLRAAELVVEALSFGVRLTP